MVRLENRKLPVALVLTGGVLFLGVSGASHADTDKQLEQLMRLLNEQQQQLEVQQEIIEKQRQQQAQQQRQFEALRRQVESLQQATAATGQQPAPDKRQVEASRAETPEKPLVTSRSSDVNVVLSGQVNRQLSVADDGNSTKLYHTDSDNSPTRLRLDATLQPAEAWVLGATLEIGLQANRPANVSQDNEEAGFDVSGRLAEAFFDSDRYGKLSLGRGFSASWTIPEVDLSGTQIVSLLSVGNLFGGLKFVDSETKELTGTRVRNLFVDSERLLLNDRLRYDSPLFAGFRISGSIAAKERSDIVLRTRHELGDIILAGAADYQSNPFLQIDWRTDLIGSVLHQPTGLNLTLGGFAEEHDDGRDADGFIVKGGWQVNRFAIGKTATSLDYVRNYDITSENQKNTSLGAFVVQNWDKYSVQFYGGYRLYDQDQRDQKTETIHVGTMGAKIQF